MRRTAMLLVGMFAVLSFSFIPPVFAAAGDLWRICDAASANPLNSGHSYTPPSYSTGVQSYYCCQSGTTYAWQTTECSTVPPPPAECDWNSLWTTNTANEKCCYDSSQSGYYWDGSGSCPGDSSSKPVTMACDTTSNSYMALTFGKMYFTFDAAGKDAKLELDIEDGKNVDHDLLVVDTSWPSPASDIAYCGTSKTGDATDYCPGPSASEYKTLATGGHGYLVKRQYTDNNIEAWFNTRLSCLAPPPACHKDPAVEITPDSKRDFAATLQVYSVKVTNNDNNIAACKDTAETYTMSATGICAADEWSCAFSPSTLSIAPGAFGSTALSVTSPATADNTDYAFLAYAKIQTPAHSASVPGTYGVFDFTIAASPTITMVKPASGSAARDITATVGSVNKFDKSVGLTTSWVDASGNTVTAPTGITLSNYNPTPATPPADGTVSSSLTITVSSTAVSGTYKLRTTGTRGTKTHSATTDIIITPPPACRFTSASVSSCPAAGCKAGDAISMKAYYDPATEAACADSDLYLQIDAKSADDKCKIIFSGIAPAMPGITKQAPSKAADRGGKYFSGSWPVPAITAECSGKTADAYSASLWNGPPEQSGSTLVASISDSAVPNSVSGSLKFIDACALSSASITNCAGGTCEKSETVAMSATFTGNCPTTGLSNYYLQIDAKSTDSPASCSVSYSGGQISGITMPNPSVSGATYTGAWTVPAVIPPACNGKTVYAWAAALWPDVPGKGSSVTSIRDTSPANPSPVGGSLVFPTTTTVPVKPPPGCAHGDHSVAITPASQNDVAATSLSYTVTVTNNDKGCPAETFTLSASGACSAAGWACAISALAPSPIDAGSSATGTITVTSPATAAGANAFSVSATAAGHTNSAGSANYIASDFTVSAGASVIIAKSGSSSSNTAAITIGSVAPFDKAVAVSGTWFDAAGKIPVTPAGVSVSYSPASVTPVAGKDVASTATITAAPSASDGAYILRTTGTRNSKTHTADTTVTIRPATAPAPKPEKTVIYIAYYDETNKDLKIAKSTNGGATWPAANTRTVDSSGGVGAYASLHGADDGTLFISYSDLTNGRLKIAKSADGGKTWSTSTVGSTNGYSASIRAADANTVFISYLDGSKLKFAKSVDGGNNWPPQNIKDVDSTLSLAETSLYAPDANTIFISYYASGSTGNNDLRLAKSTNGGETWTSKFLDSSGFRTTSISGTDANNIFVGFDIIGNSGFKLQKSSNGGASWAAALTIPGRPIDVSVKALDEQSAYATYSSTGLKFLSSAFNGATWSTRAATIDASPTVTYNSLDERWRYNMIYVSYYDETGKDLKFAKSADGGQTWAKSTVDSTGDVGMYNSIYATVPMVSIDIYPKIVNQNNEWLPPTDEKEITGTAPLNNVRIVARISGTKTGPPLGTLDCENDNTLEAVNEVLGYGQMNNQQRFDASFSTACSYPTAGAYTVRATVTRAGYTDDDTATVEVTGPPTATTVPGAMKIEVTYPFAEKKLVPMTTTPSGPAPDFTKTMPIGFLVKAKTLSLIPVECNTANCLVEYGIKGVDASLFQMCLGEYDPGQCTSFDRLTPIGPAWKAQRPSKSPVPVMDLACDTDYTLVVKTTIISGPDTGATGTLETPVHINCRPRITVDPPELAVVLGQNSMDAFTVTVWDPQTVDYTLSIGAKPEHSFLTGDDKWVEFKCDGSTASACSALKSGITAGTGITVRLTGKASTKAGNFQIFFTAEQGSVKVPAEATLKVFAEGLNEFAAWQLAVLALLSTVVVALIR